jgi:hypothetical protein
VAFIVKYYHLQIGWKDWFWLMQFCGLHVASSSVIHTSNDGRIMAGFGGGHVFSSVAKFWGILLFLFSPTLGRLI